MKLEVGMYVRTTDGLLALLTKLYNENSVIVKWQYDEKRRRESFTQSISKDYIKKASHNIRDLIEVRDVITYSINNLHVQYPCRIWGKYDEEKKEFVLMVEDVRLSDVKVKSIVTKEQLQQSEYVVE